MSTRHRLDGNLRAGHLGAGHVHDGEDARSERPGRVQLLEAFLGVIDAPLGEDEPEQGVVTAVLWWELEQPVQGPVDYLTH